MSTVRVRLAHTVALVVVISPVVYFLPLRDPVVLFSLLLAVIAGIVVLVVASRIAVASRPPELNVPSPFFGLAALIPLAVLSAYMAQANGMYVLWGAGFEPITVGFLCCVIVYAYIGSAWPEIVSWSVEVFAYVWGVAAAVFSVIALSGFVIGSAWVSLAWIEGAVLVSALSMLPMADSVRRSGTLLATAVSSLFALWICGWVTPIAAADIALLALSVVVPARRTIRYVYAAFLVALIIAAVSSGTFRSPQTVQKDSFVQPSLPASVFVLDGLYQAYPHAKFIGYGPLSFRGTWDRYYPQELNTSPLALLEIDQARSSALTMLAEFGVIGLVLFVASALFALSDAIEGYERARRRSGFAIGMLIYVGTAFCIGPISAPVWYLGAFAIGMAAQRDTLVSRIDLSTKRRAWRMAAAALACIAGIFLWVGAHQALSYAYRETARASEDTHTQLKRLQRSVYWWKSVENLRDASRAALVAALTPQLFGAVPVSPTEARLADQYAVNALQLDHRSFASWLTYLSERVSRAIAGDNSAFQDIDVLFANAASVSKTRPELPYLYARLAHAAGDDQTALESLRLSLSLKSDYADAMDLYRSIEQSLQGAR